MDEKMTVLVNGAGTVGNRVGDVLLSLGLNVLFGKFDARPDDIKTTELHKLQEMYNHGNRFTVYAADGPELEARVARLHTAGFDAHSIGEAKWNKIDFVIDCTDTPKDAKGDPSRDPTARNVNTLYLPNKIGFGLNGGANPELVRKRYFVSIPGTAPFSNQQEYRKENALTVSCNSHTVTTLLKLLSNAVGQTQWKDAVREISISYHRRHDDPHKGKKAELFTSVEVKSYHQDEMTALVPECEGYLAQKNFVARWPVEHFHIVEFMLDFERPTASTYADQLRAVVRSYPRAVLVEAKSMSQKNLARIAEEQLHIPDGDVPFPVYFIQPMSAWKVGVLAFTPQRGIVAPSNADYALFRTGLMNSMEAAFAYTNEHGRWKGVPFGEIKAGLEKHMKL